MPDALPAITGVQLVRLLRRDGWQEKPERTREGIFFYKRHPDGKVRTTVIPMKRRPLTPGTLSTILGTKQSGIGRAGLLALIERHGLK